MKKKLILIALLLVGCNKYASSENMYYTMNISPYDGYCLVFNDDFTLMKYGHNTLSDGLWSIEVENNNLSVYPYNSNRDANIKFIGEFIKAGELKLTNDKAYDFAIGTYILTDFKYEGGWNND